MVEILVVIIIIGILAAIAIPIFLNQRRASWDSAITQDLRNVAAQVTTWTSTPGAQDKIRDMPESGSKHFTLPIIGEGGQHNLPGKNWNIVAEKYPDMPKMAVSDGTVVEYFVIFKEQGSWKPHDVSEFCLTGSNKNSNYDFRPASGMGAHNYHRYLFYDMKAGGVKTMDELVEVYKAGGDLSCTGHVGDYIKATGG